MVTSPVNQFEMMENNSLNHKPKCKILFVCLGNICRSSAAEGVMRHLVEEAGVADQFEIDSAGILSYHRGELPDPYYGGAEGFEYVLDLLEDACAGLLQACLTAGDTRHSNGASPD